MGIGGWLKRLAGIDPIKEVEQQAVIDQMFRHDIGPAKANYLRTLFPSSVFTKKMTPARRENMRSILLRLRPAQRAVVYRRGWNKGVTV